mmetsp:Transcript_107473/g.213413  ORF Transcript_107473/g.213413 Transcript_107473/m.213413 type:complete len:983 (-) Transcript_107473:41-2989(-)
MRPSNAVAVASSAAGAVAGAVSGAAQAAKEGASLLQSPTNLEDVEAAIRSPTDAPDAWNRPETAGALSFHGVGNTEDRSPVKIATYQYKNAPGRTGLMQAAFIPPGKPLTKQRLLDLLTKEWRLGRPNLLVNLDAGAAHPIKLTTKRLLALRQFDKWCENARIQKVLSRRREADPGLPSKGEAAAATNTPATSTAKNDDMPSSSAAPCHAILPGMVMPPRFGDPPPASSYSFGPPPLALDADEVSILDRMMFEKLLCVYVAVLDAAEKTNNFVVVDRASPGGSSPTAELLLEMALQQTDAKPVILVIDTMTRLRSFKGKESERQLQYLGEVEGTGRIMGTDMPTEVVDVVPLYMPFDFENDNSFRGKKLAEMPLPGEPIKDHLISHGVDIALHDGKMVKMNPKRLWSYHYSQFLFSSGTHYLILEEEGNVDLDVLGATGGIFAHGGTVAYRRMRAWLQHGKPTVMLFNSGGATQAFASLHASVVKKHRTEVLKIMEDLQIVSDENWAKTFGLPEVMMMDELKKRAPVLMRKSIVSVDVLKDSAEDVMNVVTGCFAAAVGHLPELGLRTAEAYVVLQAWSQHMVMHSTAAKQRKIADILFWVQIFFLFLTILLSAIRTEMLVKSIYKGNVDKSANEVFRFVIILLPIILATVTAAMQRKRALEKWEVLNASAMRVVTEIYKFRARVLDYATKKGEDDDDEGETANAATSGNRERAVRMKFVGQVQKIFANVLDGDMNVDSLNFQRFVNSASTEENARPVDEKVLLKHVVKHILGVDMPDRQRSGKSLVADGNANDLSAVTVPAPSNDADNTIDIFRDIEEDDFVSPISIETYMEKRMKPLMIQFCAKAPWLSRRCAFMDHLSMLVNAVAVALAIPGSLDHWVTMAMSVRALIMNVVEFQNYQVRLRALNGCLRDLQNLQTWWDSLSIVDRRTGAAKSNAVLVTEQAFLSARCAGSAQIATAYTAMEDTHENEENDKGNRSKTD